VDPRAPPQLDFDANEVRTLIAKYLGIDAELVTDEVHFSNDFDLDSLGRLVADTDRRRIPRLTSQMLARALATSPASS
jgi:hypothetical protein